MRTLRYFFFFFFFFDESRNVPPFCRYLTILHGGSLWEEKKTKKNTQREKEPRVHDRIRKSVAKEKRELYVCIYTCSASVRRDGEPPPPPQKKKGSTLHTTVRLLCYSIFMCDCSIFRSFPFSAFSTLINKFVKRINSITSILYYTLYDSCVFFVFFLSFLLVSFRLTFAITRETNRRTTIATVSVSIYIYIYIFSNRITSMKISRCRSWLFAEFFFTRYRFGSEVATSSSCER